MVKFKRAFCVILIFFLISVPSLTSCTSRETAAMPPEEETAVTLPAAEKGSAAGNPELTELMNLNLRYILNDWWNSDKINVFDSGSSYYDHWGLTKEQEREIRRSSKSFRNWKKEDDLYICLPEIRGYDENSVRPISHAVYCIASALRLGYYDKDITGISEEDAKDMCIRLITSIARRHKTNDAEGWGDVWQSPLWAENIGLAAWLLWEDIPAGDRTCVINMIRHETSYVMDHYDIPYYRDKEGVIVSEGDTKGEEIAWHAKILALSRAMFPEDERCAEWEDKLFRMLAASAATPEDAISDDNVDGIVLGSFLEGSNINSDGTAVNHGRIHVDYMTTIYEEMAECIAVYKLAGLEVPEAAVFNLDLMYEALVNLDLGVFNSDMAGHHFYERDENGNPTEEVTMPEVNDWGMHWYANCYLADVTADTMGLDARIDEPYKASIWAELHLKKIKDMILRDNADGIITGRIFQEGENDFVSGDLFQMHNLVEAYIISTY